MTATAPAPSAPGSRLAGIFRSPGVTAVMLGLVATVVSAIRSPNVSFFTDEAVTISLARRTWPELWAMLGNVDAVHGLYYAIAKVWSDLVGIDEFRLRLLSALAAGLAVALTFALGRLLVSRSFGIVASAVCMLLPRLTWAGIEARPWAFVAAFAVAASLLLVIGIRSERTSTFVGYALVAAVGCVLNVYITLVVVAHAITVLLVARRRRVLLRFFPAAAFAGLVALPVLVQVREESRQLGVGASDLLTLARQSIVNVVFVGDTPTPESVPAWFNTTWLVGAVLLAIVACALIVLACSPEKTAADYDRRLLLALAIPWIVVPIGVVAAYSLVGTPIFQPRYFTSVVPAAALLIALGLRRLRSPAVLWSTVAIMLIATLPVYASQRVDYAKDGTDWSTASSVISQRSHAGEGVYFMPRFPPVDGVAHVTSRRMSYAYPTAFAGLDDLTLLRTGAQTATIDGDSALLEDVTTKLESHPEVWMIYGNIYPPEIIAHDLAFFDSRGYVETDRWTGPRSVLIHYSRKA